MNASLMYTTMNIVGAIVGLEDFIILDEALLPHVFFLLLLHYESVTPVFN